jgi:hypothetical protein
MLAAVATSEARLEEDPTVSVSAAVAVPVASPGVTPDRTRATNSRARLEARMNTTVLSALKPRAVASMGRRPIWSEARPANKGAASTPAA